MQFIFLNFLFTFGLFALIGQSVGVHYQEKEGHFDFQDNLIELDEPNKLITSVVPADFNNDLLLDLLVTISTFNDGEPGYQPHPEARVYWRINSTHIDSDFTTLSSNPFRDQPLLIE